MIQMGVKFLKRDGPGEWNTVAEYMKVVNIYVNECVSALVFDERPIDLPLFRNRPIEHFSSGLYLVYSQRDVFLENFERTPVVVTRYTSMERVKSFCERMHLPLFSLFSS